MKKDLNRSVLGLKTSTLIWICVIALIFIFVFGFAVRNYKQWHIKVYSEYVKEVQTWLAQKSESVNAKLQAATLYAEAAPVQFEFYESLPKETLYLNDQAVEQKSASIKGITT